MDSVLSALLGVAATVIVGQMGLIGVLWRRNGNSKKGNPGNDGFTSGDREILSTVKDCVEKSDEKLGKLLGEVGIIKSLLERSVK